MNAYSPDDNNSLDDFSDSEIQSAISGPSGGPDEALSKKRKRGEKRARGRPATKPSRAGSTSVFNGDDGRSTKRGTTAGAASVVTNGEHEGDEEDDDDEDDPAAGATANAGLLDAAELEKETQNRYLFRETVGAEHQHRYDSFNRVKLRKEDVRRLVNQTLSQSVPQNVVSAVQAYTKMFAGMLVESAREVQAESMATRPTLPDDRTNRAYKRMRLMQPEANEESESETDDEKEVDGETGEGEEGRVKDIKGDPDAVDKERPGSITDIPEHQPATGQANRVPAKPVKRTKEADLDMDDLEHIQPGAWSLAKYIEEADRGPLLPDHLREALRRYKSSRAGGSVGFTGISLARPEVVAPRVGGKRLFR